MFRILLDYFKIIINERFRFFSLSKYPETKFFKGEGFRDRGNGLANLNCKN